MDIKRRTAWFTPSLIIQALFALLYFLRFRYFLCVRFLFNVFQRFIGRLDKEQDDDKDKHYCRNREENNGYKVVLQPFRFALDNVCLGVYDNYLESRRTCNSGKFLFPIIRKNEIGAFFRSRKASLYASVPSLSCCFSDASLSDGRCTIRCLLLLLMQFFFKGQFWQISVLPR